MQWMILPCLLWQLSSAALPPGYEDLTFCPPERCLCRKPPTDMVGPKSLYFGCCEPVFTGEPSADYTWKNTETTPFVPWGTKMDTSIVGTKMWSLKEDLLKRNHHLLTCEDSTNYYIHYAATAAGAAKAAAGPPPHEL
jgi:hypothetical protein